VPSTGSPTAWAACCRHLLRPATQLAWGLLSLWTGITFVGLFSPIAELLAAAPRAGWSGWETFWVLFYAAATWGNAGFLREQVCRSLCPFARMQPLLTDPHTPRMLYDARRGEPRGPRPSGLGGVLGRGRGLLDPTTAQDYVFRAAHPLLAGPMPTFSADRLGDCTDCAACISACPMQLDIRQGRRPTAWPAAPAWKPAHSNSTGPVSVRGWCATAVRRRWPGNRSAGGDPGPWPCCPCCWRCLPAAPGACSESTRPVGVRWYQLRASDNAQLLDDQRHFVGELGTLGPLRDEPVQHLLVGIPERRTASVFVIAGFQFAAYPFSQAMHAVFHTTSVGLVLHR
jgi:ferredoxin